MPWMTTYTGKSFNYHQFDPANVCIADIAHALSMQCRFNGHTKKFYSVAEHSMWMSFMVPEELEVWALFHDAAEAYISDLPRPLKQLLPEYRMIEMQVEEAIITRLGLTKHISHKIETQVKRADLRMLATEREQLLLPSSDVWSCLHGTESYKLQLSCLSPEAAEAGFLARAEGLKYKHCLNY